MNSLNHFEIIADKPKRAIKFYTKLFGWKFSEMMKNEYWVFSAGKGAIGGGLTKRVGLFKKKGGFGSFVCTFEVKDLEGFGEKVKKAGGKWANDGGLIHGVGFHQYFKDTEGNIFGCLQPDKKAKTV